MLWGIYVDMYVVLYIYMADLCDFANLKRAICLPKGVLHPGCRDKAAHVASLRGLTCRSSKPFGSDLKFHGQFGGFLKWGCPLTIYSIGIFHYKPSILGYTHLSRAPFCPTPNCRLCRNRFVVRCFFKERPSICKLTNDFLHMKR